MNFDAHQPAIAQALTALDTALTRLGDALAHRDLWLSVQQHSQERAARRAAITAYQAIEYAMEDEANASPVCLGVLGVPADIVKRALAVNAAKTALQAAIAPIRHQRTRVPVKGEEGTQAIPVVRVILRRLQRSDVNLLAAYRKIPVLPAVPRTITYTRAHTRAVYRKSVADIETMLLTLTSPTVSQDRARLAALSPRESELAYVKDRYANIRANVWYVGLDPRGRGRVQVPAELPLMYAIGRHSTPPAINYPSNTDEGEDNPKHARQSQLEPQPYLSSLPVYRYRVTRR
jgi:hypothetical protein